MLALRAIANMFKVRNASPLYFYFILRYLMHIQSSAARNLLQHAQLITLISNTALYENKNTAHAATTIILKYASNPNFYSRIGSNLVLACRSNTAQHLMQLELFSA